MNENSSKQFPLPGAAVVLLALGVFIISDSRFETTRPDNRNTSTNAIEEVPARLWQDPFEAVQLHLNKKHVEKAVENNKDNMKYTVKLTQKDTEKNEFNLTLKEQNVKNNITRHDGEPSEHGVPVLTNEISKLNDENSKSDLHILAVMVTGGAYAEDKENRIRSRYAVTSALLRAGYVPDDSEHIAYIETSIKCKDIERNKCGWPPIIPYELYKQDTFTDEWMRKKSFSKNVLILWLDDERVSKYDPINALAAIQEELTKDNNRFKFDVVGPASSTSLIKMYDKVLNKSEGAKNFSKKGIRVFSPRATLDNDAIKKILDLKETEKLNFPGLTRTISTDDKLVDNLLCEMLGRGINPYHEKQYIPDNSDTHTQERKKNCSKFSKFSLNQSGKKDYIVLIREGDTTYSRNFKDLFRDKVKVKYAKVSGKDKPKWLLHFSYLKGLDGEIVNLKSSDSNKVSSEDDKSDLRRSVGANQFDYLRRLSSQLKELEKGVKDEGSIKAIGIVGSDTYDKLLILQALRNHFPDVLFFTTDLDARMLHHSENKWVRNLVVASTYGLTPDKNKYETFQALAFRDSYQTALYNTMHRVLINTEKIFKLPVKIFEIGNNSAVDYSDVSINKLEGDIQLSFYDLCKYIALALGLITLLIFQSNNHARLYIAAASFIMLIVFIWVSLFFEPASNKEFQAMFTGTSVWPTYIIRMVASILAFILIANTYIKLKLNTINIIKDHGLSDEIRKSFKDEIRGIFYTSKETYFRKIFSIIQHTKKWMFHYQYSTKISDSNKDLKKSNLMPDYFITSWGARDRTNEVKSVDSLFNQYLYLAQPKLRLKRVFGLFILYFFLSIVFLDSFSSFPVTPFTGKLNAIASVVTLFAVLFPYIFLIFLVSDITRLNSRFVELLSKYNMTWPGKIISDHCKKYGFNNKVAIEKLKLDFIVQRSIVVDKFIFLPFIILTLMILSRSSYFDRWHTPPQLALVILLGAAIALFSAVRLRISARNARSNALITLKNIYKEQLYIEEIPLKQDESDSRGCSENMSTRLFDLINEIESMSKGPFLPIAKHPIISAVAMPFGGIGGLYLIEHLTSLGI